MGTQERILTRALVDPGVRERKLVAKQVIVHWREKLYVLIRCPYRKPTQVGEERILRPAGEVLLRNSANLPRNFGKRGASKEAAENRPKRLFIKNTGFCKVERRSIGADACPVLEG